MHQRIRGAGDEDGRVGGGPGPAAGRTEHRVELRVVVGREEHRVVGQRRSGPADPEQQHETGQAPVGQTRPTVRVSAAGRGRRSARPRSPPPRRRAGRDPSARRTPSTRPPAASIPVTVEPVTTRTPRSAQRVSSASARVPRPPRRYQPPKASSAYGMAASAAGDAARVGTGVGGVPVEHHPQPGIAQVPAAQRRAATGRARSRPGRRAATPAAASDTGESTGRRRMSRHDASQIRPARRQNRCQSSAASPPRATAIRAAKTS